MKKELTNHEKITETLNQLGKEDLAALQQMQPEALNEDGQYISKHTPEMGVANKKRDINNSLTY